MDQTVTGALEVGDRGVALLGRLRVSSVFDDSRHHDED